VASADADLEAAAAQVVQAGQFPRQVDRVVEVVVEHQRADAQACRAVGHRHERRERRPALQDVVPGREDVEAGVLGRLGLRAQLLGRARPDLQPEAEAAHAEL
jgi:hypothetical protein